MALRCRRRLSRKRSAGTARTNGSPATVNAILSAYGTEIFSASMTRRIPPELIVMTIAVETAAFRKVNFTGPRTFRWEQGVTSYSAGPMQILESTAKDVIAKLHLVFAPEDIPPQFTRKPDAPPSNNPLYDGDTNISLGTDYISLRIGRTGLIPSWLRPTIMQAAFGVRSQLRITLGVWRPMATISIGLRNGLATPAPCYLNCGWGKGGRLTTSSTRWLSIRRTMQSRDSTSAALLARKRRHRPQITAIAVHK